MKLSVLLTILLFFTAHHLSAQISIKNYKQPDNQTFYISNDSSSQRFNALSPKKPIKTNAKLYYTWFKYNQIYVSQGGYDGRIVNGNYVCSYRNNNLKIKGTYKNGLKINKWFEWYGDGKLKEITNWQKGQKNGKSQYYSNGKLVRICTYKKDLLTGKTITYKDNGEEVSFYKKNILVSSYTKSLKSKQPFLIEDILKKLKPKPKANTIDSCTAVDKSSTLATKKKTTPLSPTPKKVNNTPAQTPKQ